MSARFISNHFFKLLTLLLQELNSLFFAICFLDQFLYVRHSREALERIVTAKSERKGQQRKANWGDDC